MAALSSCHENGVSKAEARFWGRDSIINQDELKKRERLSPLVKLNMVNFQGASGHVAVDGLLPWKYWTSKSSLDYSKGSLRKTLRGIVLHITCFSDILFFFFFSFFSSYFLLKAFWSALFSFYLCFFFPLPYVLSLGL